MSDTLKNYITDGSDRNVQDVISKLKFISRIREGEILDTKSFTLQEWDWTVSAYRTFVAPFTSCKQGRDITLKFYRTVITEAFTIVISYIQNDMNHFLYKVALSILDAIEGAVPGLENHSKTYVNDAMHVAKVEALIESLQKKLVDIREGISSGDTSHIHVDVDVDTDADTDTNAQAAKGAGKRGKNKK
jgi:hypothetical protein